VAKNPYDILGVQKDASPEDIKKAYRNLSKELHPDKHKGDKAAETRFKEVNEAYEVLSNPEKKRMYDQFGSSAGPGGAGGQGGFGGFDFSQYANNADFADLFENFFGGQGGRRGQREERGADREVEATIALQEVLTGAKHTVRLRRLNACDTCKGSGAEPGSKVITCTDCGGTGQVVRTAQSFFGTVQQRVVCQRCHGSGQVPEKACTKCRGEGRIAEDSSFIVDIPAGIEDGQTLRLRGEGDAGRRKSTAGDLYVHIHVTQDPRFERDGADIRSEVSVPVLDAILGKEITIETVHGKISLKVPEGTQPDQVFRIKGKGLPLLNTSRTGDHYVTANVIVPTKLSRSERKILEEWKKIRD